MRNFLTFILFILSAFSLLADELTDKIEKNPIGTEFWLCFMKNHEDPRNNDKKSELNLELFISSSEDTEVTVEIKALRFKKIISVKKNEIENVKLSKLAQIKSSEIIEEGFGVHVVSKHPISVYGLNRRKLTTDTFLGLPTNVLGQNYRAVCYSVTVALMAQFAIVATEDNTKVRINPTVETHGGKLPNEEFTVTLNQGDVYQVQAKNILLSDLKCDLTGSLIQADKKIAVFSGHQCSYVPYRPSDPVIACNHLVEQLPPISSWGKHFYIGKLKKRSNYNYRVVADKNNTKIFENSELLAEIDAGEFLERIRKEPVQVTSNNPILVSQYSQGYRNGDSIGDPMMLLISPTQQFLDNYRFATPVNGSWEHFINVIIPTKDIGTLSIDGKPVPTNKFSVIGKSRYSIAYLPITYGAHDMTANVPFGMTSYGFGFGKDQFDAYGTIGGQSFLEYTPNNDTLAPTAELIERDDGNMEIIFRDDRENDLGLMSVEILYSENFNVKIPRLTSGMPQISYIINTRNNLTSSIIFSAMDLNGNEQTYSICFDYVGDKYVYKMSEGENICAERKFTFGFNYNSNLFNYSANFNSIGNISTVNNFESSFESNTSYSINAKYNINYRNRAKLSIGLIPLSGGISSKDPESFVFEDGELIPFVESRSINFKSSAINIKMGLEYTVFSKIYLGLGYSSYLLSDDIEYKKNITSPLDRSYANGLREKLLPIDNIGNMNTFLSGAYVTGGIEIPFNIFNFSSNSGTFALINNISISIELEYEKIFTEIGKGTGWTFDRYSLSFGLQYKL